MALKIAVAIQWDSKPCEHHFFQDFIRYSFILVQSFILNSVHGAKNLSIQAGKYFGEHSYSPLKTKYKHIVNNPTPITSTCLLFQEWRFSGSELHPGG